jgi:hypothetical protein
MIAFLVVCSVFATVEVPLVWAGKEKGTSITDLSAYETAALSYMREEEKLARDVYLVMFEYWGADIFTKIAGSEQQHMDTMKTKLDKYGLPDPALPYNGLFTDAYLQGKYDELVEIGANSLTDGLRVGATIEEIDMVDIQHAIDVTNHIDVVVAYQNLLEGSKSHLRAYVNTLAKQGDIYVPQYINQELFDAIMGL